MPRPPSDKRARLTAAAIRLARRDGLDATTLAAIANEAGVAPGSVYYYFKTKADVAAAIADGVADSLAADRAALPADAVDGLAGFLHSYVDDADAIVTHGSLLATAAAGTGSDRAHREALDWIAARFESLGYAVEPARARALHLLTGMEGGAALAHALTDAAALEREATHLERWVRATRG